MGKLSDVLKNWPSGTVVAQSWFEQRQIGRQLAHKYVKGGWIEKIGHGAYIKAGETVDWLGGIYALQHQLELPIHVGGKTALELMGRAHFVPLGKNRVLNLYNHGLYPNRHLPRWFLEYFKDHTFNYNPSILFGDKIGLEDWDCGAFQITISSTERALLEILAWIPKKVSFEHGLLLLQGKDTLRVDLLQELLQNCRSQVTKRLFLYLSKRCQLPWLERLNIEVLALGEDKRKIGDGEHYDPEFKLFVPKLSIDDENNEGL